MHNMIVRAGGPCPCQQGRYVRFVIPRVPGLEGVISCRGVESPKDDVREHRIPSGAELQVRVGMIHV
jgi:hypothetical protein